MPYQDLPPPGNWRSALYRKDAPGAVLDGHGWAQSWPEFLAAIRDRHDSSARELIANAALSERVPAEGGFLVPERLRSELLAYMTPAIIRPRAMVIPMDSERVPLPVLDNPSQASSAQALGGFTLSFTPEASAITASAPAFGRTVLEAWKLAGLMKNVPNELVDDAAGAFGSFLSHVLPMGYAWAEDDAFLNGTGVGQPQGLIYAPCAVGVDRSTASEVLLADLVAMFKALHPASKQAGLTAGVTSVAWLMSATVMDQILDLYLLPAGASPTSGSPVTLSDWFSAGDGDRVAPSFLGLPAFITDHQPALGTTGDVILADLRHYAIGDRMEMVVEPSRSGASFIDDATNFRVKSRVDGRYWIQSATTTQAGQSVSPVVVLDTHS